MPNTITIQIRLISGEIIPFVARSRMGVAKYTTIARAMCDAVIAHLHLARPKYMVQLVHDDDEEQCQIQLINWKDKWSLRQGRIPDPSEYDINSLCPARYAQMKGYVDKERRYHDGDLVHAIVSDVSDEMADEQPIAIEEDVREDEFLDAWHMELQEALDAIE